MMEARTAEIMRRLRYYDDHHETVTIERWSTREGVTTPPTFTTYQVPTDNTP